MSAASSGGSGDRRTPSSHRRWERCGALGEQRARHIRARSAHAPHGEERGCGASGGRSSDGEMRTAAALRRSKRARRGCPCPRSGMRSVPAASARRPTPCCSLSSLLFSRSAAALLCSRLTNLAKLGAGAQRQRSRQNTDRQAEWSMVMRSAWRPRWSDADGVLVRSAAMLQLRRCALRGKGGLVWRSRGQADELRCQWVA